MKIKAACIGTPQSVIDALSGTPFASSALSRVIGEALGVQNVLDRPAEYYVQNADQGPAPAHGKMGVEVRLTGVSRNGRTPTQFHTALRVLVDIVKDTVSRSLAIGQKCQIFCVIMLDGEVEMEPGSGRYSNNLEGTAEWVEGLNP